jgi:ATP-dependent helicase IRC3
MIFALRPYQEEALDAIVAAEARGIRRPLLALPTGTGKTVVFAHLIRQRGGRSLVLVHRDELIWQAAEKLQVIAPEVELGIVKAARDEVDAPCVLASVQTLSRETRLARLPQVFQTVIVDEAHHGVAETYRRVLTAVGTFEANGPLTVGVTATPMRGDYVGLDAVFQEIVYQKSILEMILAGYLADLRGVQVGLQVDFR